jgi:hypothetical protein
MPMYLLSHFHPLSFHSLPPPFPRRPHVRARVCFLPRSLSADGAHHDALTELARENLLLKHQLTVASAEVDRLKHVLEAYDISQEVKNGSSGSNGKVTPP